MAQQKVRAIARGFIGGRIRNKGDEFYVESGSKASWFVPAESANRGPKPPKGRNAPVVADGPEDGGGDLA